MIADSRLAARFERLRADLVAGARSLPTGAAGRTAASPGRDGGAPEPEPFDEQAYVEERNQAALRKISERMTRRKPALVVQTRPGRGERGGSGYAWLRSNSFNPHRWQR